jgi:hypothetical protein
MKRVAALGALLASTGYLAAADSEFFAGGLGGISTLSADAQTSVTGPSPAAAAYKPENGPAINLFAGWHVNGYVTFQANYVYNTNDVAITRIQGNSSYDQARNSRQDAAVGDVLLYFRNLRSWVRPYLSAGAGAVRIVSSATELRSSTGSLPLPAQEFSTTRFAFRVAVGVDLLLKSGWGFRYSFSETKSGNPFSGQLVPAGQRALANFQNLFGLVKYFGHRF